MDIPHCYEVRARDRGTRGVDEQLRRATTSATVSRTRRCRAPRPPQLLAVGRGSSRCQTTLRLLAQGPTFANHLFTIAAQSAGYMITCSRTRPGRRCSRSRPGWRSPGMETSRRSTSRWSTARDRSSTYRRASTSRPKGICWTAPIPWTMDAAWNDVRGDVWSAYSAIERVRMHPESIGSATSG